MKRDEIVQEMVDRLVNFPVNGKPPMDVTTRRLLAFGFIEEHEVKKACRECGTPRTDYRFMKLTDGGRLFRDELTR